MTEDVKCVICDGPVEPWPGGGGYGHNPEPVKDGTEGRACNQCNYTTVLQARLIREMRRR